MRRRFLSLLLVVLLLTGIDAGLIANAMSESGESIENIDDSGDFSASDIVIQESTEASSGDAVDVQETPSAESTVVEDTSSENAIENSDAVENTAGVEEMEQSETGDNDNSEEPENTEELENLEGSEIDDLEKEEEPEEKKEPFSKKVIVGNYQINMLAAEGVFPKGAYISAIKVSNVDSIVSAIEEQLSDSKDVKSVQAFDIKVYNNHGEVIQPDTSYGDVHVSITGVNTAPAIYSPEISMEVFHMNKELDNAEQVGSVLSMDKVSFDAKGFSTYAVVSLVDAEKNVTTSSEPTALVKEMKVEGLALSTDETKATPISKDTEISVSYVFKNSPKIFLNENNKTTEGIYIYTNETYQLPSIPSVCVGNGLPGDIDVSVDGATEPLGTIHFESDGSASFNVTLTTTEAMELAIHDAGFKLKLQLNVNEDVNTEVYALAFGDNTYYVKVKEKMAQPPVVTKKAVGYANGDITWEVQLTNNAKPIEYSGLTFTDTIGENQVYVADSFTVLEGDATTLTSSTDTKLVWNYGNNDAGHVARFQYKTRVDFLGLTSDATEDTTVTKDVKNTIKVEGNPTSSEFEKLSVTETATQSISKVVKSWVTKDGGALSASGTASFTVVIQNNGYALKELHLIDTITADTGVEIQITNLTITNKDGVALAEDTDYKVTFDGRKQDIEFLNRITGDEMITVKYNATIVDYAKYLKQNHSVPSNSATITYKYDNGNGKDSVVPKPPAVKKVFSGKGISANAALTKSFVSYNPSTHEMEWKVVVNYNEQNLYNVTIEDTIPAGQSYVEDSVKPADGTTIGTVDSSTAGKVLIPLGDLEEKSATFTLRTKLDADQSLYWASNQQTKTYINSAKLISYESDKTTENKSVTVSATGTCKSTVITKKADTYDYDAHTIRYELTLNSNKMEMTNVNVTDELASELELISDSVKITSGAAGAEGFTDSLSGNTLTLHFEKLTDEVKVEFVAKIKDTSIFDANKTTKISNQASLTSAEYSGEVTSTRAETSIDNIHFKKDRGTVSDDVVPYTIKLNQAQEPIYKSGESEIYVQDILGESLTLDKSSIHLYEANVAAGGVMTEAAEVALEQDNNLFIGKNGRQTAMKVILPNTSKAYILKYSAAMTSRSNNEGAYNNDASLMGSTSSTETKSSVDMSAFKWSGAQMSKRVYAMVILKDKNGEAPLPGGHFALFDGDTLVDESTTDANGEIYFVGELEENHTYTLREQTAPDRYEIPEGEKEKTLVAIKGKTEAAKSPTVVYNVKKSKEINLILLDKDDKTTELTGGALSVKEGGTSASTPASSMTFKATLGVVYSVNESSIPFGYKGLLKDGCSFVINEKTEVLEFSGTTPENAEIVGDTIKAYDERKQSLEIMVDDQSTLKNRSLVGAKMVLEAVEDDDSKTKVDEWTSTGEFVKVTLPEGNYLLTRTIAPNGYDNILRTMKFSVSRGLLGKLSLNVIQDDANKKIKTIEDIKLVVNEDNTPGEGVVVDFGTPEDSDAPKLEVYEIKTDEEGNPISIGDTPVWTSDGKTPFKGDYQVDYVLVQQDTESGRPTLKSVYFTIDNDGNVLTKDSISPDTPYRELPKEPGATTPTIIMEKLPEPVTPSGKTSSNSSSENTDEQATGTTTTTSVANADILDKDPSDEVVGTREVIISITSDENKLAQTGGFVGALTGYLTGIILVLVGWVMAFGRRTNNE